MSQAGTFTTAVLDATRNIAHNTGVSESLRALWFEALSVPQPHPQVANVSAVDSARILIVDDEPAMLENCERILGRAGFRCTTLGDPLQFRQVAADVKPDAVVTDLRMPGADGMTILAAALADDPGRPVIIFTAYASISSAVEAIREGAFDYLTKPFTADQLLVAVDRAVRYRRLSLENEALREEVGRASAVRSFLGSSSDVLRLLDQVRKVAATEANVLLTGESGTGKELIARSVHELSPRNKGPFVPVDCAALPEGLLESELFGYERGAFTGAVGRRKGLIAEANGGTFFLDELAELTPTLQSKLLRVLEERQIRRLGDNQLTTVDIRVIAATNADLEKAVADGTFRRDLYYRLNVVGFRIPPLRERGGDLRVLLRKFLAQFAAANGRIEPAISPGVWPWLERWSWPGNVRELKNLAERLVALDDDGRIDVADLPDPMRAVPGRPGPALAEEPVEYEAAQAEAMRGFRAGYVRRLLDLHGGNVTQAARAAGVSRRTLHRWIAELDDA